MTEIRDVLKLSGEATACGAVVAVLLSSMFNIGYFTVVGFQYLVKISANDLLFVAAVFLPAVAIIPYFVTYARKTSKWVSEFTTKHRTEEPLVAVLIVLPWGLAISATSAIICYVISMAILGDIIFLATSVVVLFALLHISYWSWFDQMGISGLGRRG